LAGVDELEELDEFDDEPASFELDSLALESFDEESLLSLDAASLEPLDDSLLPPSDFRA
jgi:hypothetical protein